MVHYKQTKKLSNRSPEKPKKFNWVGRKPKNKTNILGVSQCQFNKLEKKKRNTCSSPINIWSLSLSIGPCLPPLRGFINTNMGDSGGVWSSFSAVAVATRSRLPGRRLSPALGSFNRMESRMANRRYCGIKSFFFSSSLSIVIPDRVQLLNESIIDDRALIRVVDDGESMSPSIFLSLLFLSPLSLKSAFIIEISKANW